MSGRRRSLRLKRQSHHIATDDVEEFHELQCREMPQKKRQRRLTAHQLKTENQIKQPVAPRIQQIPEEKFENFNLEFQDIMRRQNLTDSSSESGSDIDGVPNNRAQGYISSGPSVKVAPGKRIKWRQAIREEDIIRQNLTSAFMDVTLQPAVDSPLGREASIGSPPTTRRRHHS